MSYRSLVIICALISRTSALVPSSNSPGKVLAGRFPADEIPKMYRGRWYSPLSYDTAGITRNSFLGLGEVMDMRHETGDTVAMFAVKNYDGKCAECVELKLLHPNVIEYKRTTWNSHQTPECECGRRNAKRGRAAIRSLLYRHANRRSVTDCPAFVTDFSDDDDGGGEFELNFHEFVGGQYVGPCGAGGGHAAVSCDNATDRGHSHLWFSLNRCVNFDQLSHRSLSQDIRCVGHWKSRRHGGGTTLLVAQVSESEIWADGRARYLEDEYRCYAVEEMPNGEGYKIGQANGETCVGMTRSFRHLHLKRVRHESVGTLPHWLADSNEWNLIPRNSVAGRGRNPRDAVRIEPARDAMTVAGTRYKILDVKRSDEKWFEATLIARTEECGPPQQFCLKMERWGDMINLHDLRVSTTGSADDCSSGGTPEATLVAAGVRRHVAEGEGAPPTASPPTMRNVIGVRNALADERLDAATVTEVAERVVRRLSDLNQEYMLKTAGIVRSMAEELREEF